jgi:SMC interacting uncharacterized protein involved in chromosome segregation
MTCKLCGERAGKCVCDEDSIRVRANEMADRLEVDPGGSDKIDELEEAMRHLRHDISCLKLENQDLKKKVREWASRYLEVLIDYCLMPEKEWLLEALRPQLEELVRRAKG